MEILTKEVLEYKLQELVQSHDRVMLRYFIFGGVEQCLLGQLGMDFEEPDSTPYFYVQHQQQYAFTVRFYGDDVRRIYRGPKTGVPEIYLGPKNEGLTTTDFVVG